MAKLTPTDQFPDVYQIETVDPVAGGAPTVDGSEDATGGYDNVPHRQLLDRTYHNNLQVMNRLPTTSRNCVIYGAVDANNSPDYANLNGTNLEIRGNSTPLLLNFASGMDKYGEKNLPVQWTGSFDLDLSAFSATVLVVALYDEGTETVSFEAVTNANSFYDIYPRTVAPGTAVVDEFYYDWKANQVYRGVSGPSWDPVNAIALGFANWGGASFNLWVPFPFRRENVIDHPVGTIIASGVSSQPYGWLPCDGSEVSRTYYERLYNAIGTSFGPGDGATTFNVPDLRGEFLRGVDDGTRGVDPDSPRSIGDTQADAFAEHNHSNGTALGEFEQQTGSGGVTIADANVGSPGTPTVIPLEGGDETRPRNVAVEFYIKF